MLAILILVFASAVCTQPPTTSAADFLRSVVGDWVGTYEHAIDDEPAEDTYFKVVVKQIDQNSYTSQFTYLRTNPATGNPEQDGTALVKSTIEPDGSVKNIITGEGRILVEGKPKQQTYSLTEALSSSGCGLVGNLGGKISVTGLPFGAGKNGSINDGISAWTVDGNVLTIEQSLKARFKVLMFSKSYCLTACSKATRGTDVAALMKRARIAEGPADTIPGG